MKNKIFYRNLLRVLSLIIIIQLFLFGCITEPEQTDLDPTFNITIITYEKDTGNYLSGAAVILKTDPYRNATTNSNGRVTFTNVQQHEHKLHLTISKSVTNPDKYYYFDSYTDGYSGGIDFYSMSNHTFTINVPNIHP